MENVKALYILLLFAAFSVPLVIFFCLCAYCGLTSQRRSNHNHILYSMATQDYFQHTHAPYKQPPPPPPPTYHPQPPLTQVTELNELQDSSYSPPHPINHRPEELCAL